MIGISDFVSGTLAYLSNCAIALLTLIGWSLRLRPIIGALRCKVRSEFASSETPDSRVMLFIGCSIFGTVLTYSFRGFAATVAVLARAAIGASALPKVAVITSILLYFTCELAIAQTTSRKIAPGRRGSRNRQVLRYLFASLLIQIAIYEPIAINLLSKIPDITWFKLTGVPLSLVGDLFDDTVGIVRLIFLLFPFFYLWTVLEKAKSLLQGKKAPRCLGTLPLDLLGAALAGSLLTAFLYPEVTPKIVTLHCRAVMGKKEDEVHVAALFRNDADGYWTPRPGLKVNLVGTPSRDWVTEGNSGFKTYADDWAPPRPGEGPEQLLVGPHREVRFLRHVTFPKGYIGPGEDTGCSLSNKRPAEGLFGVFSKHIPDEDLEWQKITPADFQVGDIVFDMSNATQDDLNAAASDEDAGSSDMPGSNATAPANARKK